MARKKVNLQRIESEATRRATFKKRRKGLMKKASELSTLCDVRACVVVYGENEAEPEVWPSMEEALPILARFKAMPELDQCKKMMNQEGFLRQRITKLQEQIHKSERENRERETKVLLHEALVGHRPGLVGLTIEELTSLGWMVEMRISSVKERIDQLRAALPLPLPPQMTPPSLPPLSPYVVPGSMSMNMDMNPTMYQAPPLPQQQQSWLDMVRSGGDLGALVYSGFTGASSSGAGTSSGGRGDPMQQYYSNSNLGSGFSWADIPGPSTSYPPL